MKTAAPPDNPHHGLFCGFAIILVGSLLYLTGGLFSSLNSQPSTLNPSSASPPGTQSYYELDRMRIDAADAAERQQELHLTEIMQREAEWDRKLAEATERLRVQRELDEFNLEGVNAIHRP